jgi:diadenosine tetraphosphate (Ap4A) HIT family hydrolase
VRELHDLPADVQAAHLADMAAVAHAVYAAFRPRKLNYEALGNSVPHLHWWITPRYEDDPQPNRPIWEDPAFLRAMSTGGARLAAVERDQSRRALLAALHALDHPVVADLC